MCNTGYKIFFSIVCLILFFSCKKENLADATNVSGYVSNKITGQLVSNMPIKLIECDGIPRKCLTTIKTIYTDANGIFNFSFQADYKKSYALALGNNEILAGTPYPYYFTLKTKVHNSIQFEAFPLKKLHLKVTTLRQDKNWLQLVVSATDNEGYLSYSPYNGAIPSLNSVNTFNIVIQAGRTYAISALLSNKTGPYTYVDPVTLRQTFSVANIDTTFVNFSIQ